MKTIFEPARDIPVRAEADIVVVGGGPSGIMAAYAAAGEGKGGPSQGRPVQGR